MKIWLLEDNEKSGPFESFTIRERVANGELYADTPAWFDGAGGWVTLADVPTMTSAFPRKEEEIIEHYKDIVKTDDLPVRQRGEKSYRHGVDIPEHLQDPPKLHPIQRLFARLIDVMLYSLLVYMIKISQGIDIYGFQTPTQHFLYSIPYVVIDGLLMHLFGTTPGKYFLGIRVSAASGGKLSLGASLLRSGRVWVIGLGMFTILMPLSFLFSWMISRKFGKFLWDLPKNTHVAVEPIKPIKAVIVFLIVMTASYIMTASIPEWMRLKGDTLTEQLEDMKNRQQPPE